ncbi:hypothetical protein BSKO_11576 [Bryopsis sp. KO-2023]|nr:hypothetical protein BSKO_11576 [Bryopsis sp. KO-2023]
MNKSVSDWFSRFARRGGEEKEKTYYVCPAYRPYQEQNCIQEGDENENEQLAPNSRRWNPPALIPVERTSTVLAERQGLLVNSAEKSTRDDTGGGKEERDSDSSEGQRKNSRGRTIHLENEQAVPKQTNDGVPIEESSKLEGSRLRQSMSKLHLLKRRNESDALEAGPLALHTEIRRQKQRNAALAKTIEDLTAEQKGYQDRLDAVVEVHAHLRSENEQKQLKMEELEELSRQLKHQNDELQNGASEAERNATFQNLLLELRTQITGLKKAVADGEREATSLREELSTALNEKAFATRELDTAQKRISSMERERKIVRSMQKNIEREQYSARLREPADNVEASQGITQSLQLDPGFLRQDATFEANNGAPVLSGSKGLTAADRVAERRVQADENDENVPPVKPFVAPVSSRSENRVVQF